jgi:hypothetical protein
MIETKDGWEISLDESITVLDNFQKYFGDKELSSITSEDNWDSCPKLGRSQTELKEITFYPSFRFFQFHKNSS